MNAERLLALYERVAEAPDAVPRLRRFVLDLAVRGKLVAQKAGDEPASELLNKTNARLTQAKRGRKKEQGIAERQDLIFEIPAHWKPLFVAQALQELQTGPFGSSLHKKDYRRGGTPVLNPASIQNGRIVPISDMAVGQSTLERLASFKVRTNDILMARRGEMGRCAVVTQREEGWLCGTGSLILRPSDVVFSEYLTLVISSPTGRAFLGGAAVGTTMQNLNQSILLRMPFGLPPLAEQRRIVAKVEELMALLDRLEAARTAREATRDRLTAASLARLTAPDADSADSPANARFTLGTLPALTNRLDQIKPLRQTILNLAVRGKLVEQDPTDEPTISALKRTKSVCASDGPFPLPRSWAWVSVGAVARTRLGKMLDKARNKGSPRPYLRNINVRWFEFDLSDLLEMPFEDSELEEFSLRRGDVLICEGGEPGRAAVWDEQADGVYFQKAIHRVRFTEPVEPYFFLLCLKASAEDGRLAESFTGTGIKHFTGKGLRSYQFPLPPLAEQHRIVAKVDALMALCVRLEAALTTADTTRAHLLEALLHEALDLAAAPATEAAE